MKAKMLTFTKQDSPIHRLTAYMKLILFVVWSVTGMITYDTRCLIVMLLFSLLAFRISKVQFQDYAFVLYFILIFFLLNHIAIFIFSPLEGVRVYGTRHDIMHIAGLRYGNLGAAILSIQYCPEICGGHSYGIIISSNDQSQ